MGTGKSQETLNSIGLQTPSERGSEEQKEMTGEGNYSLKGNSNIFFFVHGMFFFVFFHIHNRKYKIGP